MASTMSMLQSKVIDSSKLYDVTEALELACKTASAEFDQTVELHVRLGVDGRHADPSRSAALSCCPTAPARPSASAPLPRALLPLLLRQPALTSWR